MKFNKSAVKRLACAVCAAAVLIGVPSWAGAQTQTGSSFLTAYAAEKKNDKIDKSSPRWVAKYGNLKLYKSDAELDAKEIFKNLTYERDYFSGTYCMEGFDDEDPDMVKKFLKKHKKRIEPEYGDKFCPVPYAYYMRENYEDDTLNEIYFLREDGTVYYEYCGCEFADGKLSFTGIYGNNDEPLTYDVTLAPDGSVTLSYEGDEVTMMDCRFDSYFRESLSIEAVPKDGKKFEDIEYIEIYRGYDSDGKPMFPGFTVCTTGKKDYEIKNVCGYFGDDGIFDFSWSDLDGSVHSYKCAYVLGEYSIYLLDGENIYSYCRRT